MGPGKYRLASETIGCALPACNQIDIALTM